MLPVGEDLSLEREERAARVDEVEARQRVLLCNLLGTEVLLHGHREVRAAFHGRVVRDDHALAALDHTDARDDAPSRRLAVVHLPRCECVQLEERSAGVDEPIDAFTREQLAARPVTRDRTLAAAGGDLRRARAQLLDERLHLRSASREIVGALHAALQEGHRSETNHRPASFPREPEPRSAAVLLSGAIRGVPAAVVGATVAHAGAASSGYLLWVQVTRIHAICRWRVGNDVVIAVVAVVCIARVQTEVE